LVNFLNNKQQVKQLLDEAFLKFNREEFIENDPISIPHSYTKLQDVEITALWTALLSWGQRKTIINKAKELFALMDNQPYEFIMNASDEEMKTLSKFKHRTFQFDDTLAFIDFFKKYYTRNQSLEDLFLNEDESIRKGIEHFHEQFFSIATHLSRTKKHVPTPSKNSASKRLNMFLRWMVRTDEHGVDFGLWKKIDTKNLMIPLDIHVARVSTQLGLLTRKQRDWKAVEELTKNLRMYDAPDPVKYDYALFGLGVLQSKILI